MTLVAYRTFRGYAQLACAAVLSAALGVRSAEAAPAPPVPAGCVKGKFSVLPYMGSQGLVDTVTDPQLKKRVDAYFDFVRTRLMPSFDIAPEIISHGMVINTETGPPLARQYAPQEIATLATVDLHGTWRFSLGKSWPASDVAGQKSKEPEGEDLGVTGHWEKPEADDSGWSSLSLPGLWKDQGFAGKNGYGWYRKRFQVPAAAAGKKLYLVVKGIEHPQGRVE
jgi:hypothetical protein